ncbi:PAP/OAS1 substrate-binding domain superfamily [Thalictrum thalictroides]|uniref:PAP/OAS1 substrate-binding domain superfamily n=1 Tax=Thalictrum thalictroides TaxID=46969 RepID=A0A7J6WVV2_THATH|nr:PAP/OAS1 substrate-binding domain superfamily [Thalictrum thalictroides]
MGYHRVSWQQLDSCLAAEDVPSISSSSSSNTQQLKGLFISDKRWRLGEETAKQILCLVKPTTASDQTRKAITFYLQCLFSSHLGIQVLPFGSVPLNTYLPDGDIDLTALSSQNVEDVAKRGVAILRLEQQNTTASAFEVKDVQYICAKVKLIRCLVQSIAVDISFNQYGGLSTLYFLEQIDCYIGHDHLFKRSIVLVKAWCYYESRILGAHHGLISTYALEIMVLYVFQFMREVFIGPLEVLYRFLDYFSKFDWNNYGISLDGPVCLSSLPQIVVKTPETDGSHPLLSKEYLRHFAERVNMEGMVPETNSRAFIRKHLNIIDPLKENNNLGRSVSQGNFCRIRSAFTYGARLLHQILLLPKRNVPEELNKFFKNMINRSGNWQKINMRGHVPISSVNGSSPALVSPFVASSGLVVRSGILRPRLAFYTSIVPGTAMVEEEMPKPQGIGTFFPNMMLGYIMKPTKPGVVRNADIYINTRLPELESSQELVNQLQMLTCDSEQGMVLPERTPLTQRRHETSQDSTLRIPEQGMQISELDSTETLERDAAIHTYNLTDKEFPPLSANRRTRSCAENDVTIFGSGTMADDDGSGYSLEDSVQSSSGMLQYTHTHYLTDEEFLPLSESGNGRAKKKVYLREHHLKIAVTRHQDSTLRIPGQGMQISEPDLTENLERDAAIRVYHLTYEEFPPLSVNTRAM